MAHDVAEAWKSRIWCAIFSLVSIYHAANFFAPSIVKNYSETSLMLSNTLDFSDITLPPNFLRPVRRLLALPLRPVSSGCDCRGCDRLCCLSIFIHHARIASWRFAARAVSANRN